MLGKHRFTLTTLTILMVLAFSAMWAGPAFADDSTPPPVDTPTEVAPPPADEPAPESPVTELLAQLPEGTEVVVTDSAGEAIPLASQDAAEAVSVNDPRWCPVGVTPGAASCSINYTNLGALVTDFNDLAAGLTSFAPSGNGVIWIQSGSDTSAAPITISGLAAGFAPVQAFSLTLQGGWSGANNLIVTPLLPSVFNQQLSIINWLGNITLKDIVIDGANSSVAANDNALTITTTKNILLDRVVVQDNNNSNAGFVRGGAKLDNNAVGSIGTVTINNSDFQGNEGGGLVVFSRGVITTNNLTANLNGGAGAVLDNTLAVADKAVTMKGLKQFSSNGDWGLSIYSDGAVTLSTVVANNNSAGGVYVENTTSLTKLGVTVVGMNSFVGNTGGSGLEIYSQGTILAANLNASDNNGSGAILDNCYNLNADGDCDVTVAKAVSLTGVNTFNNNSGDGLAIVSYGAITVSNLNASNNTGAGAYIDNQWVNNAVIAVRSVGTWTLNGYGRFNVNGNEGLLGYSYGNMLLNNVTANFNGDAVGEHGVELSAFKTVGSASVTLKGVNNFNYNFDDGLYIDADGTITLNSVLATFNGGDGAELYNNYDLGKGVTLTGTNFFMNNNEFGLYVTGSAGAITLSNLTASFNGFSGTYLDNVHIFGPTKPYNVTLTGSNTFNDNGDDGLQVFSFGAILINNLTADENGLNSVATFGYGAYLDNCIWNGSSCDATPKTVTLNGSVNLNANFESGLYVDSHGAVTLNNVSADGNGRSGAEIYNSNDAAKPQNVTLKGSNSFNGNGAIVAGSDGLLVNSYGAIALNNVTANFNTGNGAYLDNFQGGSSLFAKPITLTGVNSFIGNNLDGLYFDSIGVVVLNRVNADWNGGIGIEGYADGGITLICGHTFLNGAEGYHLESFFVGPITIKGIYSSNNGVPDFTDTVPLITKACALP